MRWKTSARDRQARAILACMLAVLAAGAMGLVIDQATRRGNASTETPGRFDGDRAFDDLRAQCRFGPRPPGSDAHEQCLDWITTTCKQLGLSTSHQTFRAYIPLIGKSVRLTNVVALHQPEKERRILLSAHWDTRPVADQEMDPSRARMPIIGANDGASGVAVLLELARQFRETPPKVGVVFAFFDGEDSGETKGSGYCLGSTHMAGNMRPEWEFEQGINLDMVGDRDLTLPMEGNSLRKARSETRRLWQLGSAMYPETFLPQQGMMIFDDHVPFLERGKPVVNVIDFAYPYWHTLEDTEDKCSAGSLERVGRVIASFVQNL